jgi:hypothetical protein
MRPAEGGAFVLPSVGRLASAHRPRRQTSDVRRTKTSDILRDSPLRDLATNRPSTCSVAVGRREPLGLTRQTFANLLRTLCSSKRCRRAVQLLRHRCKECAGPGAPMIVRCACRRGGGVVARVVDPPSAKSWLRVNEIALVAAQMEVAAKRRVHIGHSFGQSPIATLPSWFGLANPDCNASRLLTICRTTRARRPVVLVGRRRKIRPNGR